MSRAILLLAATALVAGCDSKNPFMEEEVAVLPNGDEEQLEPGDPNVSVNNRFAYDPAQNLTMNAVEFDNNGTEGDTSDDTLVINNLPFDGPDGRYDLFENLPNGTQVYRSRQTPTTGQLQHYAVFIKTDFLEATSAASGDWIQFGNAGANINRDSFALPGSTGEYVYTGTYAATRTFSDRSGIEIVYGDVQLLLDELDFDPSGEVQGDIVGTVFNRQRAGAAGAAGLGDLPNVVLAEVSFDTENGIWKEGTASTFFSDGTQRASGFHEGMIGGPEGQEIGGYSIITGVADVQTVRYQVVTYRTTQQIPVIDPFTGSPVTDPFTGDPLVNEGITTATSSGLDDVDIQDLQNQINARQNVVDYLPATGVPAGAEILSDAELQLDLLTEYDAREIGVFIGDVVPE